MDDIFLSESAGSSGSASRLEGRAFTLGIFISTPEAPWPGEEKMRLLASQRQAEGWLQEQARRYGVDLSFLGGGVFGLDSDVSVPFIPCAAGRRTEYADWIHYLLDRLGYPSPLQLWHWARASTNCTCLHVLAYANARGRGYAMPFVPGMENGRHFVEGALLYRWYPDGNGPILAASIAHEILHLYGAWDLYTTLEQAHEKELRARRWFPNDVMLRVASDLGELEVSALTAWRLGWGPQREPWYAWFDPSHAPG